MNTLGIPKAVHDFIALLKLMDVRHWHRLMLLCLGKAAARVFRFECLQGGVVLPFRPMAVYAEFSRPSGLRILIDNAGQEDYADFSTTAESGVRTLFDVGASGGFVSIIRCRQNPQLRSICFEPNPGIFCILERNIALNDLQGRVLPVHAAVGEQGGTMRLYVSKDQSMASATGQCFAPSETRQEITVQVISLDEYARQHGVWPEAVKIDTEGCEELVLLGAAKVLAGIKHLVLEWHSEELRDRCLRLLQPHGFQVEERRWLLYGKK